MAGKKILIGITASISAYKTYDVIRALQKEDYEVRCMVSPDGVRFINTLTLEAILQNVVYTDLFGNYPDKRAVHICLAEWADVIAIVPASADIIAKAACGIADNIILSTLLASKAQVLFAPAMHTHMWRHVQTQKNVDTLQGLGISFVGPIEGALSDRTQGVGHIASVETIVGAIKKATTVAT
jgi:phosphopantothenoylcysteine synthetase/decarboxylase